MTFERVFKTSKKYTYYSCASFKSKKIICLQRPRFDMEKLDQFLLDKILNRIINENNMLKIVAEFEKRKKELLNKNKSKKIKIRQEINAKQKKIDNLVEAVANGSLPRNVIRAKFESLKKEKDILEGQLNGENILAFPKVNSSKKFLERFSGACRHVLRHADVVKRRTFLKTFIKKIDLTKESCKVEYDLARLIVSHQDVSTLRAGLVVPTGTQRVNNIK